MQQCSHFYYYYYYYYYYLEHVDLNKKIFKNQHILI